MFFMDHTGLDRPRFARVRSFDLLIVATVAYSHISKWKKNVMFKHLISKLFMQL